MTVALPVLSSAGQGPTWAPAWAAGPRSLGAVRLLRISLTDRCNLRCLYCMPDEGLDFADRADVLSADDLLAVASVARDAGVTHFKLTGGEPTLRPDLPEIVRRLRELGPAAGPDAVEISMTTNGLRLGRGDLAARLADAGLDRVTLSLDALNEASFARLTGGRGFRLADVWRGVDAAEAAGLGRLKLNVVVVGGVNDDAVAGFAALTRDRPWTVRFIEYMPLGESTLTRARAGLPGGAAPFTVDNAEIRRRIAAEHGPLRRLDRGAAGEPGVGPAELYALQGAAGRLGFISAMSRPFCETCNRLRLTATGELRACLFDGGEVSVLDELRRPGGPRPAALRDAMARCVAQKPETHAPVGNRAMSQLGG